MNLVGTKRPTISNKCLFKTSTGLSADQMLCQGRTCIAPQTLFQLTRYLRKTFLLTHKFGTAWAIEMTADRRSDQHPMGAATATRTWSRTCHKEVKCSTTVMSRDDDQLITTRHSREVKGCNTMTICGCRTQPLRMMAI